MHLGLERQLLHGTLLGSQNLALDLRARASGAVLCTLFERRSYSFRHRQLYIHIYIYLQLHACMHAYIHTVIHTYI